MTEQEKFNQGMWAVIAVTLFIITAYSISAISNDRSHYYDDPNAEYPTEFEMRNGDTW